MQYRPRGRGLAAALALALVGVGCGGVTPIDVHDERLPLESRLWVGGAEDAVAIAGAALDDARRDLVATARWRSELPDAGDVGPAATGLVAPLHAMADARQALAERRRDRGQADLALALARRDLVYAETALRHDLAVHDLAPLRAAREAAERRVTAASAAVDDALGVLDRASEAFWSAYGAQAASGVDDTLVWLARAPKPKHRSVRE